MNPLLSLQIQNDLISLPVGFMMEQKKQALEQHYYSLKKKYEHNTGKSWCKFSPFEITTEEKWQTNCYGEEVLYRAIYIRWVVTGRAFFLKRTFSPRRIIKHFHSHKNCVPKKKRGKPILRGNHEKIFTPSLVNFNYSRSSNAVFFYGKT